MFAAASDVAEPDRTQLKHEEMRKELEAVARRQQPHLLAFRVVQSLEGQSTFRANTALAASEPKNSPSKKPG
jgi:hypothetical protein